MSVEPSPSAMTVKLMPDWGVGPLWVSTDGGVSEPYDAAEIVEVLPLTAELRADISAWDERFQATFDPTSPQDSAFPTPQDEEAFIADGRELARRLRAEAPSTVVLYETIDGRLVALD